MSKPSSQWKVLFVSGALTLAVVAVMGGVLSRFGLGSILARFFEGSEDTTSSSTPALSVIENLQTEGGVIANEAQLLSSAACPGQHHQAFEQLKQQGIHYSGS